VHLYSPTTCRLANYLFILLSILAGCSAEQGVWGEEGQGAQTQSAASCDAEGAAWKVNDGSAVNLREGPSTNSAVVTVLPSGVQVVRADPYSWQRVKTLTALPAIEGYVVSSLVRPCNTLPSDAPSASREACSRAAAQPRYWVESAGGVNIRAVPTVRVGVPLALLSRFAVLESAPASYEWMYVRTLDNRFGFVARSFLTCQSDVPGPTGCKTTPGLSGGMVVQCAGLDFTPQNCPGCFRVQSGFIVDGEGKRFSGLGWNLSLLRDGGIENPHEVDQPLRTALENLDYATVTARKDVNAMRWDDLKRLNVKVIRMFATGGHLSKDWGGLDTWVKRTVAAVKYTWEVHKIPVIISFADYYHALPGETLVPDNTWSETYDFCGNSTLPWQVRTPVRPWPWYRKGQSTFAFTSDCISGGVHETIRGINYEQVYKPFVGQLVRALKDYDGVFAWSIGNELRALGRGGFGADEISQDQALDIFARFLEDMIFFIREEIGDKNHLIIPGVQNIVEVADANPRGAEYAQWKRGFDRMLKVPFNAWNLTFYNDTGLRDPLSGGTKPQFFDVLEFRKKGVPVIATEYDFFSPQSNADLEAKSCSLVESGVSVVAPWVHNEMSAYHNMSGLGAVAMRIGQRDCGSWANP